MGVRVHGVVVNGRTQSMSLEEYNKIMSESIGTDKDCHPSNELLPDRFFCESNILPGILVSAASFPSLAFFWKEVRYRNEDGVFAKQVYQLAEYGSPVWHYIAMIGVTFILTRFLKANTHNDKRVLLVASILWPGTLVFLFAWKVVWPLFELTIRFGDWLISGSDVIRKLFEKKPQPVISDEDAKTFGRELTEHQTTLDYREAHCHACGHKVAKVATTDHPGPG